MNRYSNNQNQNRNQEDQYRGSPGYRSPGYQGEYDFNQNDRERAYGTPFGSNERDNPSTLESRFSSNYRDVSENHGNRGFYESSNQDRGMHSGKGPKGYRRSDERIHEDVCSALTMDPYVDASDIELKSENGVVTLEGAVEDRAMKRRAEECIEHCHGVNDIQNNLKVRDANLWEKMTGQEAKESKDSKDGSGSNSKRSASGNLQ